MKISGLANNLGPEHYLPIKFNEVPRCPSSSYPPHIQSMFGWLLGYKRRKHCPAIGGMWKIFTQEWRYIWTIWNYGKNANFYNHLMRLTLVSTAGADETQAKHATLRSATVVASGKCLLPGNEFDGYHDAIFLTVGYIQCNPPERAPRQEKHRAPLELFVRHLIYDVLAKKTIDKVLKLIRKLDWDNDDIRKTLHNVFTKPWKITYGNISLLAMLTYDLQRYRPAFAISVVDQVLEDVRRGLEHNIYSTNQRRVATIKYLGELYIYRLLSSGLIFDTLWSLVTFGHRKPFS